MLRLNELNRWLKDQYGRTNDQPNWRVVWSDLQFEHRWSEYTAEGLQLLNPEVQLLRKYPWAKERYILERLVVVPPSSRNELTSELSYEPIWVFEDRHGNYQEPILSAARFIIENVLFNQEHATGYAKYKDPDSNPKEALEHKEIRIKQLEEDLFGNETEVGDALAYKQGVGYTKES